jgi:hypothetical protein
VTKLTLAIVAIPSKDDYVWKISSEKIPHVTILALGDSVNNLAEVTDYVQHVVDTCLVRFGLNVDHRGTLGPKSADVLFFDDYCVDKLKDVRSYFLTDPNIFLAYNAVPQFETWTPHLTLGYPATPAKPDNRDYPGIGWINFDRIALWTGDYEGVEFPLKTQNDTVAAYSEAGAQFLAHHGVKGMKWGVRRDRGHEGQQVKAKKLPGLDRKYRREFSGINGYIKVNNTFAKHVNPMIQELNNQPQYKGKNLYQSKALHTKYWNDMDKVIDRAAKATTDEFGTSASGKYQMNVTRQGFGENATWTAHLTDTTAVEHADPATLTFTCTPIVNSLGQMTGLKCEQTSLMQSDEVTDFLAHFGVKGMKWGVRRDHSDSARRIQADLPKAQQLRSDPTKKAYAAKTRAAGGLHKLSDKDLRNMLNRIDMEQRYTAAMNADRQRRLNGLKAVGRILGEFGKIALPIVASAAAGAAGAHVANTYRTAATTGRIIEGTTRAIGA